jgi:hypothetical protein
VAASVAFSFASLLLLLADRRRTAVRVGLIVTLALFAIVFVMVIYPVWSDEYGGELYSRVLGIVSILAALGAIVLPVMSLLLRERPGPGGGEAGDASLSPASLALLRAEAAERGVTPDELVDSLLGPGSVNRPPTFQPPPTYVAPPAYEPPPAFESPPAYEPPPAHRP